jgi:phosphatidylserine/phosphatidylglycerophosphate/cardiolipin synthase-like enzyme
MSLFRLDASIRVEGSHSRAIADIVEQEWRDAPGRHRPAEGRLTPPRLCPRTHVLAWVRDERPMEERAARPRLG